jgi:RimJ/RimL family protein N-acetyltransferase
MTEHTDEISMEQQLHWWQRLSNQQLRTRQRNWAIWLAYNDHESPMGYAMLRQGTATGKRDLRWYVSLGLIEKERGKGYGTMIYHALANTGRTVHALIREDNLASIKAAAKAGYVNAPSWDDPEGLVRMMAGMRTP